MKQKILQSIVNFNTDYGDLVSCANKYILDFLESHQQTFSFCVDPSLVNAAATFNPLSNTITFANEAVMFVSPLSEEFFHAYQNLRYGGIQNMQTANTGYYHIEFEHALYRDLVSDNPPSQVITFNNADQSVIDNYQQWLTLLKQNGGKPTSTNSLNIGGFNYSYFLGEFEKMRSEASTPTNINFTPTAMFNLFQNLNCN